MENNKTLLASVVVALSVALVAAAIFSSRPSVNVNVSADGKPVVVSGGEKTVFGSAEGDTTVFTAVSTTEDMGVGRNLYVAGSSTFAGLLSGVPTIRSSAMTSSATTTACTFLNSSGVNRTVTALNLVERGSATSLGAVAWQAATNTIAVGVGASTKAINTTVTRQSGVDVITTTSTPQLSAYLQWKSGEYLNFVSGSTTNSGTCYVQFN